MSISKSAVCLAVAAALSGCFKLEVNAPSFTSGGQDGSKQSSPSQLPGGWRDIGAGVLSHMLAAEDGILFFAYDTLAYPDQPAELGAKVLSVRALKPVGLRDVKLGFYHRDRLIAAAKTDKDGHAAILFTAPAEGDYTLEVRIIEAPEDLELPKLPPAPLLVACRRKKTRLVVIDLDHTLVESSFVRVLLGGARPMPDSVEVTRRIARSYTIVYLTDRPDLLTANSKAWLADNGYPPGPLLLSTISKVFGKAGKFKTNKLSDVRKAYPNVAIGIGDKTSDCQAYVDNGLSAYLIPHYKDKPESLREKADEIARVRDRGRMNVVSDWREIEAGIFAKKTYPPKLFISRMRSRADRLEAAERARKRREERDDD